MKHGHGRDKLKLISRKVSKESGRFFEIAWLFEDASVLRRDRVAGYDDRVWTLVGNLPRLRLCKLPGQHIRIIVANCFLINRTRPGLVRNADQVHGALAKRRLRGKNNLHGENQFSVLSSQ